MLLGGCSSVAAGLMWAQPVLAGRFLDGSFSGLLVHRENATAAGVALAVTALVALGLRLSGRGSWWLVAWPAILFALAGAQIALGFARVLWVHIPLGVVLVAGSTALAVEQWRSPSRTRGVTA